jgi:hypothetical protein
MPTGGVIIPSMMAARDVPLVHAKIRAAVLHANRVATWVAGDAKYDERRLTPKMCGCKRRRLNEGNT